MTNISDNIGIALPIEFDEDDLQIIDLIHRKYGPEGLFEMAERMKGVAMLDVERSLTE